MFTQLNQYRVILEVHPDFKKSPSDLGKLYVKLGDGQNVAPLSAMTRIVEKPTSLTINHQGQFPVSTISFNLAPGVSLGQAVKAMQTAQEEVGLPPSIIGSFQGTAEAFQKSLVITPLLILAAIITVYIVLGILYESFVHPITILSTLPSAGVGALMALLWTRIDLNVIALIGIILPDRYREEERVHDDRLCTRCAAHEGLSPTKAIYQAGLLRFRPIMMTTMAAMLGGVPLAMGGGVGSELRQPLGYHDHRRPDRQSNADALYDPRDFICGLRSSWRCSAASSAQPNVARRQEQRNEYLGSIHSSACGHDALDDRSHVGGNVGLQLAARSTATSSRIPDDLSQRQFARR